MSPNISNPLINGLVFLVTAGFGLFQMTFADCLPSPKITLDTLDNGQVTINGEYIYALSSQRFSDTVSNRLLYEWLHNLYGGNAIALLGRVDSVTLAVDTVSVPADTAFICSDFMVTVDSGATAVFFEVAVRVAVEQVYKGDVDEDTFTVALQGMRDPSCEREAVARYQGYIDLTGRSFLFFNQNLSSFPETGPFPPMDCQTDENGFFVDGGGYLFKSGWVSWDPSTGGIATVPHSGIPGIKVPLDSLEWAFHNLTYLTAPRLYQAAPAGSDIAIVGNTVRIFYRARPLAGLERLPASCLIDGRHVSRHHGADVR